MARVPYLEVEDLEPEHRILLKRGINLDKALVNSPHARHASKPLGHYIRWVSPLDPRLREMAILQVGYLARSPYEWSHHIKIGYGFGVTDDDIIALIAETEGKRTALSPLTATVLRAAREMTNELAMRPETFAFLKGQMPIDHLVDLTLVIAQYNSVVRILATLEIDVEPDYQPYLDRHPLPAA
jgi:alkylhydroperoxidase family enzyme